MREGLIGTSGLLSWPAGSRAGRESNPPQSGFEIPVVVAEIKNKGRMPASITAVSVVFSNGIKLKDMGGLRWTPQLPQRIDSYSNLSYPMPGVNVANGVHATVATGGTNQVRLEVEVGGGKVVRTKAARLKARGRPKPSRRVRGVVLVRG